MTASSSKGSGKRKQVGPTCPDFALGGEVRRGGSDVRHPLSRPLPLAGERRKTKASAFISSPDA
jgi:hypothetical protein